jgi:hypothetical protein
MSTNEESKSGWCSGIRLAFGESTHGFHSPQDAFAEVNMSVAPSAGSLCHVQQSTVASQNRPLDWSGSRALKLTYRVRW